MRQSLLRSLSLRLPKLRAAMSTDYTSWTSSDLIARVTILESQLREQNSRLSALLAANPSSSPTPSSPHSSETFKKTKKPAKPFDFSAHPTRHIAIKFAYLGGPYNGFEHANGTVTPLPTVEEVLWKALRKARLIDPKIVASDGEELDMDYDVVWDTRDRLHRYDRQGVKLNV